MPVIKLFQTCLHFCLLLNTKEDILKNMGHWHPLTSIVSIPPYTTEVNGVHQLFGYPYSSKYLRLCSSEDIYTRFDNFFEFEVSFLGELSL